jgi:hypothetical protein
MKIPPRSLAALLVCCLTSPVLGQTEKIGLYADALGTDCSIADTGPGIIEVHMIHYGSEGSIGVSFRAPKPACWVGAIWVGDVLSEPFQALGGTQQAYYDVGYAGCRVSPIHIGKMNYFSAGTSNPCCEYPVLPSYFPTVISVDCQVPFGAEVRIGAGKVTINENENCPCNPPVAVEETTWGGVKALYR